MKAITKKQRKAASSILYRSRLLFLVLIVSCISGVSIAQQVEYKSPDFRGEWFIGLGVGPRIYFADHARQLNLVDRVTLGADMYVGKWFVPFVGARLGGSYQRLNGAAQNWNESGPAPHKAPYKNSNGQMVDDRWLISRHGLFKQQFDAFHIYGDLLFNVSNIFEGVNEDRFWTLTPFIGIGYAQTVDPAYREDARGKEVSFNLGLLNSLHVGRSVDINFDIRGAIVNDAFKVGKNRYPDIDRLNTGGRPFDGILSVNLGVAFRFGGNIKPMVVYQTDPVRPVPPPVREPVVIERVTEWKDVATDVLILFRINESVLLRDARVQLGFLARLMHEYPEGTYTITGYADEGTGNPDLNQRLSRARAERVKECLVGEFGISSTRLQTVAAGGIENRYYNDPSLSRSVIIRPNKY